MRHPYEPEDRHRITAEAHPFLRTHLPEQLGDAPLEPVLTTTYRRSTLCADDQSYRMTCDTDLLCADTQGASVEMGAWVLIETKPAGAPTLPDRILWAAGWRPVRISKFCVGLASLHPDLPANKWHRTLHRDLLAGQRCT